MTKVLFILLSIFFYSNNNHSIAFDTEKTLPAEQEERAKELFLQVKCPVCEGQVIGTSDTQIARNLRRLIRQKIAEGKSDKQIKLYLIDNYGNNIITTPEFNINNIALWLLPVIFIICGTIIILRILLKNDKLQI